MKQKIILSLLALFAVALTGCSSCHSEKAKQTTETMVKADDSSGVLAEAIVENIVSTDREYIFLHEGKQYDYYETTVMLADYLDAESQDGTIKNVENAFQLKLPMPDGNICYKNIKAFHVGSYADYAYTYGLWVGDFSLNEENVKLTFRQAFDRVMATNSPKPHSKYCVLRREVGPKPNIHPQYVFGNTNSQLYVDAVTGEVRNRNPAFDGYGLDKTLAE